MRCELCDKNLKSDIPDPEEYLFENPQRESVPTEWLEAIHSLPIRDDNNLVMGFDPE